MLCFLSTHSDSDRCVLTFPPIITVRGTTSQFGSCLIPGNRETAGQSSTSRGQHTDTRLRSYGCTA